MASYAKKSIDDICVQGKKVIARVDFNVPLSKTNGEISDDKRIRAALPTIKHLLDNGASVILVSHLGRPKNGFEDKFSMKPVAKRLAELLGQEVILAADVIGEDAKAKAANLKAGEVLMLENVRFHKEETKNKPAFAKELASMADLYVNDAFGTAHRAHASTAGLANFLPGVSGKLIQKEIDIMGKALENPERPFVAVLGGAKVSDKIGVIENLIEKVDTLIIGGGMAYTFYAAKSYPVGKSLLESDKIEMAKALLLKAEEKGVELLLPVDNVVAAEFSAEAEASVVADTQMPDDKMGLDIGPDTVKKYAEVIKKAGTVVWNGPMGVFEFDKFAAGTIELAKAVAESKAVSIIGGGDSAAAIEKFGYSDKVTHISTGGGASLEFLEGKVLPGIDCLLDKDPRRTFAAGNWKMNQAVPAVAEAFLNQLIPALSDSKSQIALAVPFTALQAALDATAYTNVKIAAQNCHYEDKGAYTGEISAAMLAEMGVPYVVLGHSERREYFAETDESVNKKVHAALNWGLRPIICCGESLAQRENGETFAWLKQQISAALKDVAEKRLYMITIAYEPIWAIGTGKTATAQQAEETCAYIRSLIKDLYSEESAANIRIQYGGSVNAKNVDELFAEKNIDGALVGGASLKVDEFTYIAKA